jgi:hypothetical protein
MIGKIIIWHYRLRLLGWIYHFIIMKILNVLLLIRKVHYIKQSNKNNNNKNPNPNLNIQPKTTHTSEQDDNTKFIN